MLFCTERLNCEGGRRMQPQILSLGDRWFHLLCGLSSPSPFLPDSDKRLYRAEALSGEEESNKSMGAGAWRLLQEERSFPLPPGLGGLQGTRMAAKLKGEPCSSAVHLS